MLQKLIIDSYSSTCVSLALRLLPLLLLLRVAGLVLAAAALCARLCYS
jgi:hypothetical protein